MQRIFVIHIYIHIFCQNDVKSGLFCLVVVVVVFVVVVVVVVFLFCFGFFSQKKNKKLTLIENK